MFERVLFEIYTLHLAWLPVIILYGFECGSRRMRRATWLGDLFRSFVCGVIAFNVGMLVISRNLRQEVYSYGFDFSIYTEVFLLFLPTYIVSIPLAILLLLAWHKFLHHPKAISFFRRKIANLPDSRREDETCEQYIKSIGKKYICIWNRKSGLQSTGEFISATEIGKDVEFQLKNASQYDSEGNLLLEEEMLTFKIPINEVILGFTRSDTPITAAKPPKPDNAF